MIDVANYDPNNLDASIHEVLPEHKSFINTGARVIGGKLLVKYMQDASDRLYIY